MRVVSQNGFIDVPYELTLFQLCNDGIIAMMAGCTDETMIMARYSSKEKSAEAINMMREAYVDCNTCQQKRSTDGSVSISEYVRNAVFQFPEDDEVEV